MFFRKKVPLADYCTASLETLFTKERETTWETLRRQCGDKALSSAKPELYFKHLRALFIEFMLIAIAKNFNMDLSFEAQVFVLGYLKEKGASDIHELGHQYSQQFASSPTDGVAQMVCYFNSSVTGDRMGEATVERFYNECYGILKLFYDDFKGVKLVSSR